jgi:hypothetical protein
MTIHERIEVLETKEPGREAFVVLFRAAGTAPPTTAFRARPVSDTATACMPRQPGAPKRVRPHGPHPASLSDSSRVIGWEGQSLACARGVRT